jgi:hypothetical protein
VKFSLFTQTGTVALQIFNQEKEGVSAATSFHRDPENLYRILHQYNAFVL